MCLRVPFSLVMAGASSSCVSLQDTSQHRAGFGGKSRREEPLDPHREEFIVTATEILTRELQLIQMDLIQQGGKKKTQKHTLLQVPMNNWAGQSARSWGGGGYLSPTLP